MALGHGQVLAVELQKEEEEEGKREGKRGSEVKARWGDVAQQPRWLLSVLLLSFTPVEATKSSPASTPPAHSADVGRVEERPRVYSP